MRGSVRGAAHKGGPYRDLRGTPIGGLPRMVRNAATRAGTRAGGGNTGHRFGGNAATNASGNAATNAGGGGGGTGGRSVVGGPADRPGYPLAGLLFCAICERPLSPMEMLGGRAYGSPCGCRLTVVPAATLERLVLDAVVDHEPAALAAIDAAVGSATEPAVEGDEPARVFRRYLAEVRVGGSLDDLRLIWRV